MSARKLLLFLCAFSVHAAWAAGPDPARKPRTVTLLTGDKVTLQEAGRVVIEPARGRGHTAFHSYTDHGHTFVIPRDAAELIAGGRLDERLFDVTLLVDLGYDDDRRDRLPLITTYPSGARAAAALRTAGAEVTQTLSSIDGVAVQLPKARAAELWSEIVGPATASARSGFRKIWLDGQRRLVLDHSVPQIGAPAAWAAGYTGQGVTVAVLDSGIDAHHPDFAGRILEARSFIEGDSDTGDRIGHGTHVASILAGSGAGENNTYRGVAPDALLLIGKVCDFFCFDSEILAGMEWAAQSGAAVVNLSLGGYDTPEMDPLEEGINRLSEEYGTLFVAAAGNSPYCQGSNLDQVGSPGTADAALAVGAVDRTDALANFSCRGPRIGDYAVKPEITAPGVSIAAARAENSELGNIDPVSPLYARLSGTSMATPHVAGAAALLAQQHPTFRAAQLKALLMASALPSPSIELFAEGAGRVDVAQAIVQDFVSIPSSLSFGLVEWPHEDDALIVRTVTYHNYGVADLQVQLAFEARDPNGALPPAGMFVVSPSAITVPAGGHVEVTVTADTRTGGPDGVYSGLLSASGDRSVRTPFSVMKEGVKYDLQLSFLDRAGYPALAFGAVVDLQTGETHQLGGVFGSAALRLSPGQYHLDASISTLDGIASMVQPLFELEEDTEFVFDARDARLVSVIVPRGSARRSNEMVGFRRMNSVAFRVASDVLYQDPMFPADFYTAHLGPAVPADEFASILQSTWAEPGPAENPMSFEDSPYVFNLSFAPAPGRMPDGFSRRVRLNDLAKIRAVYTAPGAESWGYAYSMGTPPFPALIIGGAVSLRLPRERIEYFSAEDVVWSSTLLEGFDLSLVQQTLSDVQLQAGGIYRTKWAGSVLGPNLHFVEGIFGLTGGWATRWGDNLRLDVLPAYGDANGHFGIAYAIGNIRLFREGELIGESGDPGFASFIVPPEAANYRMELDSVRDGIPRASTEVHLAWNFRSETIAGVSPLPLLAVRYTPYLDDFNRAPGNQRFAIQLELSRQPGGTNAALQDLSIDVSYDSGASWQPAIVHHLGDIGVALVQHPPAPGTVSLRATATTADGTSVEQTILDAYHLK